MSDTTLPIVDGTNVSRNLKFDVTTGTYTPYHLVDGVVSLAPETTKVIGTVNFSAGQEVGITGTVTVDGSGVTQPVSVADPVAVTGPLTDAELRASPVQSEIVDLPIALLSAFGTIEFGELTPVFQTDFVHGINSQTGVATVLNSATATTSNGRLALTCGTNSGGSAIYRSRRPLKYRAGQGMVVRFTPVYASPVASNVQLFGPGSDVDGYLLGHEGTAFGIRHRNAAGVSAWIPRASWNGDLCNGAGASGFNWTPENGFGVPVMIKYPFLGYGNIHFFVQNPDTSKWILFHTIKYANTSASIQLSNPNLFFWAENVNSGNTTTKTIYVGSIGAFISGPRGFVSNPKWGADGYKTGVTTEELLFAIRNATTYNTVTNRSLIRLQSISIGASATANAVVTVRLRIGATLSATPTVISSISGTTADDGVTVTSGNSITTKLSHATTITTTVGSMIFNLTCAGDGNEVIDLTPFDLFVAPGETLSVCAFASASSTISATLNWSEDI